MQQPLCHDSERSALLQFKQSFLIDGHASGDPSAYPKVAISCLYGSINSNSTLFSLVHLRRLDLSDNDFNYSQIPFGVGQLSRLRSLDLSSDRFAGQIPSELLALSKLVFLNLSANPIFSGELPTSIGRLGSLTKLDISSCNFTGLVPSPLGHLSQLSYLDLSNNFFSGQIPSSMANLTRLTFLDLSLNNLEADNSLNGTFPDFLQNQDELEVLFLSDNKIHGPIPKWMWNISQENLDILELDSNINKLIGEISPLICNMSSLILLDLSSNNLSGRIPQCLANLSKSLFILDLGSNNLDGPIPQTCTVPNNLRVIDLGENQFQGQIPRSFANCMMLEHLVCRDLRWIHKAS
ncbi:unnamed protein product, partial [Vitis vinifera]|uniref:Disease resistance R13L4/SHOC-2-like LRR domain-containing protein n=1 Tax=Vitis vinifera TaxID=29760 RepID=D7U7C8_VITVI